MSIQAPQCDEPPPRADGMRQLAIAVARYAKIAALVMLICVWAGWLNNFKTTLLLTIPLFFVQLPALFFRGRLMGWTFLALFTAYAAWVLFFVD